MLCPTVAVLEAVSAPLKALCDSLRLLCIIRIETGPLAKSPYIALARDSVSR